MLEKLEKIVEEFRGRPVVLTEDMDLVKDLGFTSMDLLQMVVNVEEAFNIEISDRALKGIATVGDILRLIKTQSE